MVACRCARADCDGIHLRIGDRSRWRRNRGRFRQACFRRNGCDVYEATNGEGNFTFNAVRPDFYSITVEHPGFKKFEKAHIELTPGEKIAVGELKLTVGSVNETIEVTAQGSMIQTATSERSGIITSQEIQDLTVLNRDFSTLPNSSQAWSSPRAASPDLRPGGNSFNVNGGRTTANNIRSMALPAKNSNQTGKPTPPSVWTTPKRLR